METIEVPLSQGQVTVLDAADFPLIATYRWTLLRTNWGQYAISGRTGRGPIYLHRLLMNAPEGLVVDHIDHDGLNNRRANLRLATPVQNNANSRLPRSNTSGYKGVSFHRKNGYWCAYVTIANRKKYVGHFPTAEDAARAYDARVRSMYGEFALPNFHL